MIIAHLALILLLVKSGEKVSKLCDLFVIRKHDGVSSCLKLHCQVGRLRVRIDPSAAERVEKIIIALGNSPQVETAILSEVRQ